MLEKLTIVNTSLDLHEYVLASDGLVFHWLNNTSYS